MHNQPQLQPLLTWMSGAHIFYPPDSSIRLFSLSHKTLVSVECSFIVWCSHVPVVGLSHACICIVSSHALSGQTPPRLSSVCVFSSWPDYSLHAVNYELKSSHPFCVRASLVWYLEILAFLPRVFSSLIFHWGVDLHPSLRHVHLYNVWTNAPYILANIVSQMVTFAKQQQQQQPSLLVPSKLG
jgi:hypothetical protein